MILFGTSKKLSQESSINIRCGTIHIKRYHRVTYLGCSLDVDLSENQWSLR